MKHPKWPPTFPPGTLAWCRDCGAKRMPLIDDNSPTSVDVVCRTCKSVFLTLFRPQA